MSRQIDAAYWKEILLSPAKAREALINLEIEDSAGKMTKVLFLNLENGNRIPVEDVTEEQAHEFMKNLCPSWAHNTLQKGDA